MGVIEIINYNYTTWELTIVYGSSRQYVYQRVSLYWYRKLRYWCEKQNFRAVANFLHELAICNQTEVKI